MHAYVFDKKRLFLVLSIGISSNINLKKQQEKKTGAQNVKR